MKNKQLENFALRMKRLFNQIDINNYRNICFQVTDNCNLKCSYCYQKSKHCHTMPFDTAKTFIDKLLNDEYDYINRNNTKGVVLEFIGGEPLLEIDLIDQISSYFIEQLIQLNHPWRNRFILNICSNGTLYFQPNVQKFLEKHKLHLSFSISIDGNKELHDSCRKFPNGEGSYDIAIAAAKDRLQKGFSLGSKMTLCPDNINYTFDALTNLINNGYKEIVFNCVFEKGWTVQHAKILYSQLKQIADYMIDNDLVETHTLTMFNQVYFGSLKETDNNNWCGGTGNMLSIDYKGNFYPCIRYMESSLGNDQPPLIIGNVWDGIASKQCEKDCLNCLKAITRRSQSTDECFNCPIAAGCAWCSGYNYQVFGTPNKRATYICIMHKARALANVYYWNKWYKKTGQNKLFVNNVPDEWALEIIDQDELNMLKELAQ